LENFLSWLLGVLGLLCIPIVLILFLIVGDKMIDWDVKIVNRITDKLGNRNTSNNKEKE
jgi:hypothetical protein